jgi:nitrite reductase/ring-hydroxylating ferredoxin subunit
VRAFAPTHSPSRGRVVLARRALHPPSPHTTADPITPDGPRPFVKVAELAELSAHGARSHVHLGGRHVSLINWRGDVHALDSLCYHAGGPLAVGEIEDVDGRACVSCPWHLYKIELETGEKLYGATTWDPEKGALVPDGTKSVGVRQRVHDVERRDDGWYVRLRLDGSVESDKYATKDVPGISGARRVRVPIEVG